MSAGKRTLGIPTSPIDHAWLVVMRCRRTNGKSCEYQLQGRDKSTCRICVPNNWTAKEKALFRSELPEGKERAVVTTENLEGEVTAFRGWGLVFDGQSYLLASEYKRASIFWTPGQPLKARCLPTLSLGFLYDDPHVHPHRDCTCGLYAAKEPTGSLGTMIGTVAMWGRYVEHERGWRAEYAYPKSVTSLRCSMCSQVFPWGTMKYRTISTGRPSYGTTLQGKRSRRHWCGFSRGFAATMDSWLLDAPQKPLKGLLDSLDSPQKQRHGPQKQRRTRKFWRTLFACKDCIGRPELNGNWLPAARLIVRIEHTYGLEVN